MATESRTLFGTDGARGKAGVYPMTADMALAMGRAAAALIKQEGGGKPKVVLGKDTRISGDMLEAAITAGFTSEGVDVLNVGVLPTPGVARLTVEYRADAGVVISASHNPYQDNGIKFFGPSGFKLPDETELAIERLIFDEQLKAATLGRSDSMGRGYYLDAAPRVYIDFLKNAFPKGLDLAGVKMVLDLANGAASKIAPHVFRELGAEVVLIGAAPNGQNINAGCGALHPERAAAKVVECGAHFGLSLDGDADRAIFVDERGQVVDGDQIMALCAADLYDRGQLAKKTVVATVMSNLGLENALNALGLKLARTAVGDRYVMERMLAEGYNFGGEQSGHLIFLDHNTTGDGILAGLMVCAVMRRKNMPLSALAAVMTKLPQVLVNVMVSKRVELMDIPQVAERLNQVEQTLGESGRLLVRYSGTEPKVRVMLEGEDEELINRLAEDTALFIQKTIG